MEVPEDMRMPRLSWKWQWHAIFTGWTRVARGMAGWSHSYWGWGRGLFHLSIGFTGHTSPRTAPASWGNECERHHSANGHLTWLMCTATGRVCCIWHWQNQWDSWVIPVMVRMDPYPFPFAHNPHEALRQVLKEDRHDLMLDHATASSFLFPLPCHDSLSWTDWDLDLLIYSDSKNCSNVW